MKADITEFHDLVTALLDDYGSCTDLNFENATRRGVIEFVKFLGESFKSGSLCDYEGNQVTDIHAVLKTLIEEGGHAFLEGGQSPLKRIQVDVFYDPEVDRLAEVELSFFPEDFFEIDTLRDEFLAWLQLVQRKLQSPKSYLRFEDGSWTFGDTSRDSGVILVHRLNEVEFGSGEV
ncbi:MAG: hypothetical protein ACI97A_002393 [Planctomycetota bacterium]|jgi:hypothetical protein